MSLIFDNNQAKREALRAYKEKVVELRVAEHNAMNEMLNVLRAADGLMTAAQIEAACTSGISQQEIAGNLRAMKRGGGRYACVRSCFGQRVPLVNVPRYCGDEDRIVIKGGGKRQATFVEVDENGQIILGSKRVMTIREGKLYGIEKD